MAEKASRVKFSGIFSGEPDHGAFMALESLTLGVEGKASMWKALKEVAGEYASLAATNLDELIDRAEAQHGALERERLAAGRRALGNAGVTESKEPSLACGQRHSAHRRARRRARPSVRPPRGSECRFRSLAVRASDGPGGWCSGASLSIGWAL